MNDKESSTPTPEEVIKSIKKSFQKKVKPLWKEWDREVIEIHMRHQK
jgi:hypothetical protein